MYVTELFDDNSFFLIRTISARSLRLKLIMDGESFESQVDSFLDLMPPQANPRNEHEMDAGVALFSESGVKISSDEILYEF